MGAFIIQLWFTAVLFIITATGSVFIIKHARHNAEKKWLIAGAISLSLISLALFMYILLTFIFLDAL